MSTPGSVERQASDCASYNHHAHDRMHCLATSLHSRVIDRVYSTFQTQREACATANVQHLSEDVDSDVFTVPADGRKPFDTSGRYSEEESRLRDGSVHLEKEQHGTRNDAPFESRDGKNADALQSNTSNIDQATVRSRHTATCVRSAICSFVLAGLLRVELPADRNAPSMLGPPFDNMPDVWAILLMFSSALGYVISISCLSGTRQHLGDRYQPLFNAAGFGLSIAHARVVHADFVSFGFRFLTAWTWSALMISWACHEMTSSRTWSAPNEIAQDNVTMEAGDPSNEC